MKTAVYRKEHFNAAHRLHNPAWSELTNEKYLENVTIHIIMGTIMKSW